MNQIEDHTTLAFVCNVELQARSHTFSQFEQKMDWIDLDWIGLTSLNVRPAVYSLEFLKKNNFRIPCFSTEEKVTLP